MTSKPRTIEPVKKEVKAIEKVTLPVENIKIGEKSPKASAIPPAAPARGNKIPILDAITGKNAPVKVPVPLKLRSNVFKELSYDKKPLILSTHLVPSISIELFEIFAGIIENSTETPVVLLHEARADRPVASDVVDIAFLPIDKEWKDGNVLSIGMIFEHRLNKGKRPGVYVDIVVAEDVAETFEDILDFRGHNVALPDRYTKVGATSLFFNYLKSKGENPSFFGNTLDSDTQVAALQMVAGRQTDIAILEAPVISSHKHSLPGVSNLVILDSLGPLPPYQIFLNSKLSEVVCEKIKKGFLSANSNTQWLERLSPFGVIGFGEYSKDSYNVEDIKTVPTSVRYY